MCKECGMAYSFFFNAQFHKKDCAVGITAEKIQKALEGDLPVSTEEHIENCSCDECEGACSNGKCGECWGCEELADNEKFWQVNRADILQI